MNFEQIINKYYPEADKLRDILYVHSRNVADYAVEILYRHPELQVDRDFVYSAAMLHDIGIIRCDARGIECFGTEPYICHGTIGARMLREELGLPPDEVEPYARICERHTGTGLTKSQIVCGNLPLPHIDLVPETLEEQIVCYADKFFSKTRPGERKAYERVEHSLLKFGEDGVCKFRTWHKLFG
ncbi:MAG: HD domain-containing protein [Bacteroidales bacterium]|nr:HD domain-containing protein [Bacteroidales bacterium]MCM1148394.1 HD domain-containing protein [Bacteroidales bacterium]MCM1207141.1 HD domain-containing protein [Bacillota bacterium]